MHVLSWQPSLILAYVRQKYDARNLLPEELPNTK